MRKLFDTIGNSIVSELPFFIIVLFLLSLPAGYGAFGNERRFQFVLFATAFIQSIAYATPLCILIYHIKKNMGVKYVLGACILSLFIIETFTYIKFFSRTTPLIISLLLQTDALEARLFVETYILTSSFIIWITGLICIIFLFVLLDRIWKKRPKYNHFRSVGSCATAVSIIGIMLTYHVVKSDYTSPIGLNTIHELIYSYSHLGNHKKDIEGIFISNRDTKITSVSTKAPTIICVIGESFIKRHSSLYGYPLMTNPNLETEKRKGNLFVFSDVVTPFMWTGRVMELVFSLKSVDDNSEIRDYPLFPAIFKQAGFKVAYIDNQITRATGRREHDFAAVWFLNPAKIHRQCFDFRNETTFRLDGDAIRHHQSHLYHLSKSLNIIHLRGQHVPQVADYPDSKEWEKFTASDIKRTDLTHEQKQKVAEYDNATFYNDAVLLQIMDLFRNDDAVLVYFSDHGEQVFDDERHKIARTATDITLADVKPLHEIPFIIWASNQFKKEHPDKVKAIEDAVSRPFSNDDIPYLLFDLADIDFEGNRPERSVINSQYHSKNRILIMGETEFNYDQNRQKIEKIKMLTPNNHQ